MTSHMTFPVVFLVIVTVSSLADALTLIDDRDGADLEVIYLGSAKSNLLNKKLSRAQLELLRPRSVTRANDEETHDPDGWKNPCGGRTWRTSGRQSSGGRSDFVREDVGLLIYKTQSLSRMAVELRKRYATERFVEDVDSLDRELQQDGVWINQVPRFNDVGVIPPSGATEQMVRLAVFELFKRAFLFMANLSVFLQTAQIEEGLLEPDRNYQQDYLRLSNHQEYGFYWIFCKLDISLHAFMGEFPGQWDKPTSVTESHESLKVVSNAIRHYRDYMFLITLSNYLNTMNADLKTLKAMLADIDGQGGSPRLRMAQL